MNENNIYLVIIMAEINFVYNGINTIIQTKINNTFKEMCQKFCIKT